MGLKKDIPLAKDNIRIGKQLTADNLCYLNSVTGKIENIDTPDGITNTFGYGRSMSSFWGTTSNLYNNQTNIDKISKMIGKYTTEYIVKHQPIDINKLESLSEKKAREASIAEKKRRKVENSLKIEIKNNIWL